MTENSSKESPPPKQKPLLLLDTDFVIIFSAFDLLREMTVSLGSSRPHCRVIKTESTRLVRNHRLRKFHLESTIERAIEFTREMSAPEFDNDEFDILQSIPDVDPGEAILFAATKSANSYFLLTNDKKSLRAIASSQLSAAITARMSGRVVCVAQVVLDLINTHGYDHIRNKVAPACKCDEAMREAFGNGRYDMKADDTKGWLTEQVNRLRSETGALLR
jgi:hypothetical protein